MRDILFFLRSRCCNSGNFSKRPSALILSSSLLLNNLMRTHERKGMHVEQSRVKHAYIRNMYGQFVTRQRKKKGKIGTFRSLFHHLFSTRRAIYSLPRYNNVPLNKFCELRWNNSCAKIGVLQNVRMTYIEQQCNLQLIVLLRS